jgi:hypothetical protein
MSSPVAAHDSLSWEYSIGLTDVDYSRVLLPPFPNLTKSSRQRDVREAVNYCQSLRRLFNDSAMRAPRGTTSQATLASGNERQRLASEGIGTLMVALFGGDVGPFAQDISQPARRTVRA